MGAVYTRPDLSPIPRALRRLPGRVALPRAGKSRRADTASGPPPLARRPVLQHHCEGMDRLVELCGLKGRERPR